MRYLNPADKRGQKLTTSSQRSSLAFKSFVVGVSLVLLGGTAFILAFLLRPDLSAYGMTWRDAQTYSLLVAFVGLFLARTSAKIIRLDTRALNLEKLGAIIFDREYIAPREGEAYRKAAASALSYLNDKWAIASDLSIPGEGILDLVLVSPSGVYAIQTFKGGDPRSRKFVDPAPSLARAARVLTEETGFEVIPVLAFIKKSNSYQRTEPGIKAFDMQELITWLEAQSPKLTSSDRQSIEIQLRAIAKNTGHGSTGFV